MDAEPPKTNLPKRKRRWYQFSLRTLMTVVTLFALTCAYVGWQAKIVRERQAWFAAHDHRIYVGIKHAREFSHGDAPLAPSLIRRFLGDEICEVILIGDSDSLAEKQNTAMLFPEAVVYECPRFN